MILKQHLESLNYLRIFVDIIMVTLAWMLSYTLRFVVPVVALTRGQDTFSHYIALLPLLLFCYLTVFISTSIYKSTIDRVQIGVQNISLFKSHFVAFILFVSVAYFVYDHRYSRVTLILYFILTPIFLALGRGIVRRINRLYLKYSKSKKRVIIIGNGVAVEKLKSMFQSHGEFNVSFLGVYQFHDMDSIEDYFNRNAVDVVFIVPNVSEVSLVDNVLKYQKEILSEIILIPYLGENTIFDPRYVRIDNLSAIALNAPYMNQFSRVSKRIFDIVFSFTFICVFSPVFIICALLVRLSSKGPILYKQERMGLDGRKFMCLKFRGMYTDAEAQTGPVWAKANDDRTTKIGKWLRKTSLDELPQFFNVLKGEMSIVGPRPERPVFVKEFKSKIPGYMLRHRIKAGITGWAQINGWRGDTSLEKRIECDLWYIQNWNLWLDLKIVLMTPVKGFIHPNAY